MSDLQTNTYALKGGTAIPKNADMNSYVTPGNYHCRGDSIAQTLTNSPLQSAFTLKIDYGNGTKYPRQTYRDCVTGKIVMRYYNSDTDKWGSYVYLIPTTQS